MKKEPRQPAPGLGKFPGVAGGRFGGAWFPLVRDRDHSGRQSAARHRVVELSLDRRKRASLSAGLKSSIAGRGERQQVIEVIRLRLRSRQQ
jgi:hypothetical protein